MKYIFEDINNIIITKITRNFYYKNGLSPDWALIDKNFYESWNDGIRTDFIYKINKKISLG